MNDSLLNQDPTKVDPNKDYLAELVGEGKKFKDVQDLARGKWEADLHIKNVESVQDDLRTDFLRLKQDYESRAKLEELVDQLASREQLPPRENTQSERTGTPVIDPNMIEGLVSKKVQEIESYKKQIENQNLVGAKLHERFGDNYQNVVKQQIAELDLSVEDFDLLAKNNPKLLFRTLGIDQPARTEPFNSPPRSSQRTDSFSPSGNKRTWSYYQKMRKENPELYYSAKTTNQKLEDYKALGEAFEDGDFHSV